MRNKDPPYPDANTASGFAIFIGRMIIFCCKKIKDESVRFLELPICSW